MSSSIILQMGKPSPNLNIYSELVYPYVCVQVGVNKDMAYKLDEKI